MNRIAPAFALRILIVVGSHKSRTIRMIDAFQREGASADPSKTENARDQWFTATHWSVVLTAGEGGSPRAAESLEKLCRTYWYPLYAYVRRKGHPPHDAQELTQEFFARLLARNSLQTIQREKGKFRSFLLAAMNHFLADEHDRAKAAKRGGGKPVISLDENEAEDRYRFEVPGPPAPDLIFEKRWVIALLETALEKLRQESVASGKAERFEQLKVFLENGTEPGDYEQAGRDLGMAANSVAAAVYRLRQRYRELVRAEVAHTVARPDEIDEEVQHLMAVLAR